MNLLQNIIRKINAKITPPEKYARKMGVNIGRCCFIATKKFGTEPYLVTIGNHCQITNDVQFHTHGGAHVARRRYANFDVFGKIVVEDWAYIGAGTHLMPGVTIGEGALIAGGSVVTKSVPPGEVWGGVPAKRICSVDDYVKKNLPYNTDTKGLSYEEKKKVLLSLPEEKFIKK